MNVRPLSRLVPIPSPTGLGTGLAFTGPGKSPVRVAIDLSPCRTKSRTVNPVDRTLFAPKAIARLVKRGP